MVPKILLTKWVPYLVNTYEGITYVISQFFKTFLFASSYFVRGNLSCKIKELASYNDNSFVSSRGPQFLF